MGMRHVERSGASSRGVAGRAAWALLVVLSGSACSGPVKGSHKGANTGGDDVGDDGGGYIPPDDAEVPLCDDSRGIPGNCALPGEPDAGCGSLLSYCTHARGLLKPTVATILVACLSSADECSYQV